jgi:hypothetical protein
MDKNYETNVERVYGIFMIYGACMGRVQGMSVT